MSGGAKQALHYTDVAPKLLLLAVAKGGNHLFGNAIGATKEHGTPKLQEHALMEVARVFRNDLQSGFYAGLTQGYLDDQRSALEGAVKQVDGSFLGHPVEAISRLSADVEQNASVWLA
jgi:CRISPR-associated protein Cst2